MAVPQIRIPSEGTIKLSVLDQSPVSEGFTPADALRNTIDSKRVDPPSVLEANLFSGSSGQAAPAPKKAVKTAAPAPPSPYTIEVITGNKRENKSFPNQ